MTSMAEPSRGPGPAGLYRHDHPPVSNLAETIEERKRLGDRVADRATALVGSWPFIIVQTAILLLWIAVNAWLALHPETLKAWDPYPFILLNLALSFQAAYTGPVVLMSQNREARHDRMAAQNDYEMNRKAEEEIRVLMDHLVHQDRLIEDLARAVRSLLEEREARAAD